MQLSQSAIAEFQELYRKHYGEEISLVEASKCGHDLVNLYKVILERMREHHPERHEIRTCCISETKEENIG